MSDRVYDLSGRDVTDCEFCRAVQARDWDLLGNAKSPTCTCDDHPGKNWTPHTQVAMPRCPGERTIIVPCDCAGSCSALFVAEWDDPGEGSTTFIEFYASHRDDTWRQRIKAAWAAVRGKSPYYHDIVVTPDQARLLGEFLNPLDVDDVARRAYSRGSLPGRSEAG